MTFFSDNKLLHISKQLQNNKVDELLGKITSLVQSRLPRHDTASSKPLQLARESRDIVLSASEAKFYLEGERWYFARPSALPLFTDILLAHLFHLLCLSVETLTLIPLF